MGGYKILIINLFTITYRDGDYLQAELAALGLESERQEVEAGRFNLYARLQGSGPGRRLNFNGHLDTVPVCEGWETDPLTAVLVTAPGQHDVAGAGAFVLNADGSFSYTPNAGFSGTDTFTYKASDSDLESTDATVTITVNPVNDPPEILPQTFQYAENRSEGDILGVVVATDVDSEIADFSFAATGTNTSADGVYQIDSSGVITLAAAGVSIIAPIRGNSRIPISAANWCNRDTI